MAVGDLCYIKGGSALGFSKQSETYGRLIYKNGKVYIIITALPAPYNFTYTSIYSSSTIGPIRVPVINYTQKILKTNNEHVVLTEIQGDEYKIQLDGFTGDGDSVEISYTLSYSIETSRKKFFFGSGEPLTYISGHGYFGSKESFENSGYVTPIREDNQKDFVITISYRITLDNISRGEFSIVTLSSSST